MRSTGLTNFHNIKNKLIFQDKILEQDKIEKAKKNYL